MVVRSMGLRKLPYSVVNHRLWSPDLGPPAGIAMTELTLTVPLSSTIMINNHLRIMIALISQQSIRHQRYIGNESSMMIMTNDHLWILANSTSHLVTSLKPRFPITKFATKSLSSVYAGPQRCRYGRSVPLQETRLWERCVATRGCRTSATILNWTFVTAAFWWTLLGTSEIPGDGVPLFLEYYHPASNVAFKILRNMIEYFHPASNCLPPPSLRLRCSSRVWQQASRLCGGTLRCGLPVATVRNAMVLRRTGAELWRHPRIMGSTMDYLPC